MNSMLSTFRKLKLIVYLILFGNAKYAKFLGVKIGSNCRIYTSSWGSEPFLVSIGDRVTITSGVKLITHDGSTWLIRDDDNSRYQRYAPISIGSDVFIGVNTIVMPGVTIGSKVVIGAGSVVTKDIPSNSVAIGNPARVISTFEQLEEKIKTTCVNDRDIKHIKDYEQRVTLAINLAREKNAK